MNRYIGTKLINARPMSRGEYNEIRGWQCPADEDPSDEGFLVEYLDGGKANTHFCDGYVSWSPKAVFERAYRPVSGLSFGMALEAMRVGKKVARAGWNGVGMFVFIVPGSHFKVNRPPLLGIYPEGTDIDYGSHVDIKAANGEIRPWVCSQSDMLCDDWYIVE